MSEEPPRKTQRVERKRIPRTAGGDAAVVAALADAAGDAGDSKRAVATFADALQRLPKVQLADILAMVDWRSARAVQVARKQLVLHPIAAERVVLDHEHLPVVADAFRDPASVASPTRALHHLLRPFSEHARRLVLHAIWPHLERGDAAALRIALHERLPRVESIELEVLQASYRTHAHVETFLPADASRLRGWIVRHTSGFRGTDPLTEWLRWCTRHDYRGPLERFGAVIETTSDMRAVLDDWQRRLPAHHRPHELEVDARWRADLTPLFDRVRASFFPGLRRLRLRSSSPSLFHALMTALAEARTAKGTALHAQLLELQVRAESGGFAPISADDLKRLGECAALEVLNLRCLTFGGQELAVSVPRAQLDALDALREVRLPKELLPYRTRRWEALRIWRLPHGQVLEAAELKRLAPTDLARLRLDVDGKVFADDTRVWTTWMDALGGGVRWQYADFQVNAPVGSAGGRSAHEDAKAFCARVGDWVRAQPDLEGFALTIIGGYRLAAGTLAFREWAQAWALARVPAGLASPDEPLRPTRPLRFLDLRGVHRIELDDSDALQAMIDSCPHLDTLYLSADDVRLRPAGVVALVEGLPRIVHLRCGTIYDASLGVRGPAWTAAGQRLLAIEASRRPLYVQLQVGVDTLQFGRGVTVRRDRSSTWLGVGAE